MGLCQSGEALHSRGIKNLAGVGLGDPLGELSLYECPLPRLQAVRYRLVYPLMICDIDTDQYTLDRKM